MKAENTMHLTILIEVVWGREYSEFKSIERASVKVSSIQYIALNQGGHYDGLRDRWIPFSWPDPTAQQKETTTRLSTA